MAGKHRLTGGPQISFAGEPEFYLWCAVCQDSTRVRVRLRANSLPAGCLEMCAGCGSGHDRPGVYLVDQTGLEPATPMAADQAAPAFLARIKAYASWLAAAVTRRARPRRSVCAYGDCWLPGRRSVSYSMPGEEGTWTYRFCTKRHRVAWAYGNRLVL